MTVRLQKFLADAGVASRRASEQFITEGRVTVNGRVVRELGSKVDPDHDHVSVDGRSLKLKRRLYLALNKPKGCICSRADPEGRLSVYNFLPPEWSNLYSVGRLDYNSEGLLFLTNDGEFCLRLTHPRYGVRKKYLATLDTEVKRETLKKFEKGVFHEGERLKVERTRLVASEPNFSVVELELAEGKNREVRRLFESQGLEVRKLVRVQVGAIKLGELPTGKWRVLGPQEVKTLQQATLPEAKRTVRPSKAAPVRKT